METELFFEVPKDHEIIAQLIQAVPSDWAWLDGILHAPDDLFRSEKAEKNIGFGIGNFYTTPMIVSDKPHSIMVEQKAPGFVLFKESGLDDKYFVTMEFTKNIAVGFVKRGYWGSLSFYKECCGEKFDNPARCQIVLSNTKRYCVVLKWDTRHGGKEEHVMPIVEVCNSLKLKEFEPEEAGVQM